MAKPRPTPPEPPALSEPNEFARATDYNTQATGPRELAEATKGSWGRGGRSQVLTPDPQG